MSTAPPAGDPLLLPTTVVRGIGPRRAAQLREAFAVTTIGQLLRCAPRRYEPPRQLVRIAELQEGEVARVRAAVHGVSVWRARGRSVLQVRICDPSGSALAVYFNQPYLRDAFPVGRELWLEGRASLRRGRRLYAPRVLSEEDLRQAGWIALYPQVQGVPAGLLQRAVAGALPYAERADEPLPEALLSAAEALPLPRALRALHRPADLAEAEAARRRLAWEEVLDMERRRRLSAVASAVRPLALDRRIWDRIRARIPFPLSADQERVLEQLRTDLASGRPMRRLLHGEVGSGKTAVAFALALALAAEGRQSALLAPTEILARQHIATFRSWLTGARVPLVGLLGDDSVGERKAALEELAAGRARIAIGTHALYQETVRFADLGLVVFDEQHRFGVRQKSALLRKGTAPHVLTMTATPIPRTQAWARYGSLEPCVLRARPDAPDIRTILLGSGQLQPLARALRQDLEAGARAFVVVPRIDGRDGLLARAAELRGGPWEGIAGAVIHGRMRGAEVAGAVARFRAGNARVLFGTTVVEVGLDVPDVGLMLVLDAHRLGLASLHQLRGRLGRGASAQAARLFLLAEDAAHERLRILEQCQDGFQVAAADLRLRGPGALRGTRQHGRGDFHSFDPERDGALVDALRLPSVRAWLDGSAAQPVESSCRAGAAG